MADTSEEEDEFAGAFQFGKKARDSTAPDVLAILSQDIVVDDRDKGKGDGKGEGGGVGVDGRVWEARVGGGWLGVGRGSRGEVSAVVEELVVVAGCL